MTNPATSNRRAFLQTLGAGAAGSLAAVAWDGASRRSASAASFAAPQHNHPFRKAMASYSLRKFSLDEALEMTKRIGLDAICLKSFHLPLDLPKDEVTATAAKVRQAGIELYGGGVIGLKNEKDVDNAFEYAKAAGLQKIVGAPTIEMLPRINEKIQQYDIAVCIHNHGPTDKTFPTPLEAYEKIKQFDPRFGLCHDVGHTARVGKDPAAISAKCADRLLDMHLKDVTAPTKAGHAIACGRGIIDLPALIKTLVKINYRGFLAFEYEPEANDPLPGLAESVGYIHGVMDML